MHLWSYAVNFGTFDVERLALKHATTTASTLYLDGLTCTKIGYVSKLRDSTCKVM